MPHDESTLWDKASATYAIISYNCSIIGKTRNIFSEISGDCRQFCPWNVVCETFCPAPKQSKTEHPLNP